MNPNHFGALAVAVCFLVAHTEAAGAAGGDCKAEAQAYGTAASLQNLADLQGCMSFPGPVVCPTPVGVPPVGTPNPINPGQTYTRPQLTELFKQYVEGATKENEIVLFPQGDKLAMAKRTDDVFVAIKQAPSVCPTPVGLPPIGTPDPHSPGPFYKSPQLTDLFKQYVEGATKDSDTVWLPQQDDKLVEAKKSGNLFVIQQSYQLQVIPRN
jgi:hypothetical protein